MHLLTTVAEVTKVVHSLEGERLISVDVETTGLDYIDSQVIGLGIASETDEWYVDFIVADSQNEWALDLWAALRPLFNLGRPHILISHNTPFDMYFIDREIKQHLGDNILDECLHWWDTLGMAALVDENLIGVRVPLGEDQTKSGALGLKALSKVFLGREQRVYSEDFEEWSPEERAEYGCADVRNTYDLAILFSEYLEDRGLMDYYQRYVAPMSFVTCMMETLGLKVDTTKLLKVQAQVQEEIDSLKATVVGLMPPQEVVSIDVSRFPGAKEDLQQQLAVVVSMVPHPEQYILASGKVSTSKPKLLKLYEESSKHGVWKYIKVVDLVPSNPNSYQQLAACLLAKGYRLPLTSSGNYSVAIETLEELAKQNPQDELWDPLFKMRRLEKLQGTYITAMLEMAWEDSSVHPEWNQSGTATGRYSTSASSMNKKLAHKRGPALQTIPRPDTMEEAGWDYNPREWFIARPGYCLCVADLSQAEVRMLAVMSQDPGLIYAVNSGEDLHSSVASTLWGSAFTDADPEVKKVMRGHAKQVTFGTIYGIGPGNLSERLGIEQDEASQLLNDFYDTFPGVSDWKREETMQLMRKGYVTSYLGRRRTPILIQDPPRVTAAPGTVAYECQRLQEELWQIEWDTACKKSGFDPETVEENEIKGRATRQAINFEVQGSVAELVNYGLWRIVRGGWRLLGQVHDEVIVEVPDNEESKQALQALLEEVFNVELEGVQFKLDVHYGHSWAAGKE